MLPKKRLANNEKRMKEVSGMLDRHSEIHHETNRTLEELKNLPKEITVLFIASNPLDAPQLRLDEEARSIQEMIRKSEHRDSVSFETRWATRALDVIQAINEENPAIIHFSGHGSCFSYGQAQEVVQHVDAAVGVTTTIGDVAARVFAAQFYSAIEFGLSIKQAFEQGKVALMLEGEEDTPELYVKDGLNPNELIIVKP